MAKAPNINAVKAERDRYVAFAFAAADAFFELDGQANVKYVGGAAEWLVQKKPKDIMGKNLYDLLRNKDRAMLKATFSEVKARSRVGPIPLTFETSKGSHGKMVDAFCACLPNQPDVVFMTVRASKPQTKANTLRADQLDVETGLANKDAFTDMVKELAKNAKSMDDNLDLTFLDIDGIESLRETLGEKKAEEFMEQVAAHVRAASVDGKSAGRLEDGKFGIVHEKGASIDHVKQSIEKEAPADVKLSTSTIELDAEMSEEEMGKALVYTINKFTETTGKFNIDNLDSGYQEMLADTKRMLVKFKEITTKGSFDIMLQPIVDLKSLEVHHYEALVRFQEQGKNSSPFQYITFAEEAGIIHEFDMAMCKKVIEKIKRGKQQGANLTLAVNLSGKSLQNPAFVDELVEQIKPLDTMRDNLMFELTESSQIQNLESVNNVLSKLRKFGHHVCLDDFGAGAAGFQYLRALEIDTLKIDGVYIRDGLKDSNSKALLQSMAKLCTEIEVDTIGEWVETKEQWEFLKEIGVGYGQGYLFGKPAMGTVGRKVAVR